MFLCLKLIDFMMKSRKYLTTDRNNQQIIFQAHTEIYLSLQYSFVQYFFLLINNIFFEHSQMKEMIPNKIRLSLV